MRDTPLKFDREKAVVVSCKHMKGDVRPSLEATGLAENGFGFLARSFRAVERGDSQICDSPQWEGEVTHAAKPLGLVRTWPMSAMAR